MLIDCRKLLLLEPQVSILIFRGPDNMVTTPIYNLLYAFDVQLSFVLNLMPAKFEGMVEENPMINEFFYNNFNDFIDKLYLSTNYYLNVSPN